MKAVELIELITSAEEQASHVELLRSQKAEVEAALRSAENKNESIWNEVYKYLLKVAQDNKDDAAMHKSDFGMMIAFYERDGKVINTSAAK